jgi:ankyrin repeat protein
MEQIHRECEIHREVRAGNGEAVRRIVQQDPAMLHLKGPLERTPLLIAADCCHIDMLALLLEAGASLGDMDRSNANCLHLAVRGQRDVSPFPHHTQAPPLPLACLHDLSCEEVDVVKGREAGVFLRAFCGGRPFMSARRPPWVHLSSPLLSLCLSAALRLGGGGARLPRGRRERARLAAVQPITPGGHAGLP